MDTIVMCRSYLPSDRLASALACLLKGRAPPGIRHWGTTIPNTHIKCVFFKIHCHSISLALNIGPVELQQIKDKCQDWLIDYGLTLADFHVSRIDYDFNIVLPEYMREAIVCIMDQFLPLKAMRMNKQHYDAPSVYYVCKSRHAQWYDKDQERREKGFPIQPWEEETCRQEIQCLSAHIKYMRHYYGLIPSWDNWVCLDMQDHYLRNAKPIFPPGDFYRLAEARSIIDSSTLKQCKRRKLCEDLQIIQRYGMDILKARYKSYNTYKDHLSCLEAMNISPLTIPDYFNIDCIENVFYAHRKDKQRQRT